MKENSTTVIKGAQVTLVPYLREHVPPYHDWMKDPFLQETTASEPLSLDQEYAMQQEWYEDDKKCTFIIIWSGMEGNRVGSTGELGGMIGDVNLFFNDHDDPQSAELELMIAEPSARRKGLGFEAAQLMMRYAVEVLLVTTLTAKIGLSNTASRALFERLGFKEVSISKVFGEVTLERKFEDPAMDVAWELKELSGSGSR